MNKGQALCQSHLSMKWKSIPCYEYDTNPWPPLVGLWYTELLWARTCNEMLESSGLSWRWHDVSAVPLTEIASIPRIPSATISQLYLGMENNIVLKSAEQEHRYQRHWIGRIHSHSSNCAWWFKNSTFNGPSGVFFEGKIEMPERIGWLSVIPQNSCRGDLFMLLVDGDTRSSTPPERKGGR